MKVADVASHPSLHQPHTLIFFIATLVCLAVAVLPPLFLKRDRSWERRVAWSGTGGAALCAFLASVPDWKLGIGLSLFIWGMTVFTAYFTTPYIKIRGKIYAFHIQDSQPDPSPAATAPPGIDGRDYDRAPDSYGGSVTAIKLWWLGVPTTAMFAFGVVGYFIDKEKPWIAAAGGAVIVLAAIGLGHGDASWGYPVARGQRVQFAIISIITLGVFTVLYLIAYRAGSRWPLRLEQSFEYRAHPRHQKRYP
ncbi:putative membrane protein [Mycobacterium xenopi 4042]|uniref:Putative membrane protein n=1 Tax=Mycobacterium xenopi 4042 TaxID=1299334 RepID=X8BFU2_MYCXE|nr:putative membrane protein [Mycobacterium xenopi 4042]